MESLEAFWKPLLKSESQADERQPEAIRPQDWNVVNPILSRDVKLAIKHSAKKTAPRPDGRKLTDMAAIPRGELVGLFNLWLYTGVCPTELCKGCTMLIPREAGMVDPAKFRLITISSVVLKLFHKIMAKRLEALFLFSL